MEQYNWNDIPEEQVNPLMTRKVIQMPGVRVLQLQFKKGAVVPVHHHLDEQITMVSSGALRFESNGRAVILHSGDVLRVPSDLPHSAEALDDSTSTEVFIAPTS